jgi:hypothetical protein
MRTIAFRKMCRVVLVTVTLGLGSLTALADQWTGNLSLAAAHAENDSNVLNIYVMASQTAVNPANCSSTDAYMTADPVIANQTLSMALTALSTNATVQIYVSSTVCTRNRPTILTMQIY